MYMVIGGSNWIKYKEIEETLGGKMGNDKDDSKVEDVEEGEISDGASVEEISEEAFNKQESVEKVAPKESNREARVWTMSDLYKNYPTICRGYPSGLYNLAWAQAVQNKPLNELFVMDIDHEENSKRSLSSSPSVNSKEDSNNVNKREKDADNVVIVDVEKEEGELEEGEIDLDSEPVHEVAEEGQHGVPNSDDMNVDTKQMELEKQVNSIRETLERVTLSDAEKSFEETCSQLHSTFERFCELISDNNAPRNDALINLSFAAIEAVNSVFCSMNHNEKQENEHHLSRLVSFVNKHSPPLFSLEQKKEIDIMIQSLDCFDILPSTRATDKEKESQVINGLNSKDCDAFRGISGRDLTSLTKLPSNSGDVGSMAHNQRNMLPEVPKLGVSSFKGRGLLLPLLDLHKDHDEDSLPSPTRGTPSSFPVHKAFTVGDGINKTGSAPAKTVLDTGKSKLHPYETDAVKAVSTYQQKFGRNSFLMYDRLPSPTPSEECDNEDADVTGEVSSSPIVGTLKTEYSPNKGQTMVNSGLNPTVGFTPSRGCSNTEGLGTVRIVTPANSASNPAGKLLAKSRDPRLRLAKSDAGVLDPKVRQLSAVHSTFKVELMETTISSRKQKIDEEPNLDGPAFKRQRKGSESCTGSGGWLEDMPLVGPRLMENEEPDLRKMINVVNHPSTIGNNASVASTGNEKVPVMSSSSNTASLPALLKDIAVNPTMLINILKMGQQQLLAAESPQKSIEAEKSVMHPQGLDSILGARPLVNVAAPSTTSGIFQKPSGIPKVPSQAPPLSVQDELGKVRMKPRDPRRILHGNIIQKSGSLGNDQFKTIASTVLSNQGGKDNSNGLKQEGQGQADVKLVSVSLPTPDSTRQFTKTLKNIADILSVSQASTISQSPSAQPASIKSDRMDVQFVVSNSEDHQAVTSSSTEVGVSGPSRPPSMWEDVEHLFEGYDDKQKAAIQRERARRIEEQKKLFSARKLCLVLDLDHTLLNSAKFVEVDPVHDEILRKKEEQDREKPQRHLYRFPHMGMWTKLRPGIWNFLEKASKLYELHLYTMGNRLYATEMAKVLDPKGVLFSGRVISRGDDGDLIDGDERVPKSKDLEGVLGMESGVVIIDDSVRVWPHNKLNLIVVERYTYFPCSRRQFGLLGPSLLEIDHDERPEDGTLASSLAVIERIHKDFFSHQALDEADVRNILASEQRKILGGCRIVFSRVFPVDEVNPHLHPLWQTAEQFGAVCTNQIDDQVTHVVANSLGTDKVNWALNNGRFVVHPGWVEASALLYRRANEQDFSIKPQQTPS